MSKKPFNQKLKGGLADNKKPSDFDQKQLSKGVKVELEHTKDKNLAKEIAMDHMMEDEKYYTHLNEMEKKYKKAFNLKKQSIKDIGRIVNSDKFIRIFLPENAKRYQLSEEDIRNYTDLFLDNLDDKKINDILWFLANKFLPNNSYTYQEFYKKAFELAEEKRLTHEQAMYLKENGLSTLFSIYYEGPKKDEDKAFYYVDRGMFVEQINRTAKKFIELKNRADELDAEKKESGSIFKYMEDGSKVLYDEILNKIFEEMDAEWKNSGLDSLHNIYYEYFDIENKSEEEIEVMIEKYTVYKNNQLRESAEEFNKKHENAPDPGYQKWQNGQESYLVRTKNAKGRRAAEDIRDPGLTGHIIVYKGSVIGPEEIKQILKAGIQEVDTVLEENDRRDLLNKAFNLKKIKTAEKYEDPITGTVMEYTYKNHPQGYLLVSKIYGSKDATLFVPHGGYNIDYLDRPVFGIDYLSKLKRIRDELMKKYEVSLKPKQQPQEDVQTDLFDEKPIDTPWYKRDER